MASKFVVGDRVMTQTIVNVYAAPSRTAPRLGRQTGRSYGVLMEGPVTGERLTWWQVDWEKSPDGWSHEDFRSFVKVGNSIPKILSLPILGEAELSGKVPIIGEASDAMGIMEVSIAVDNVHIPVKQTFDPPQKLVDFELELDTVRFKNGKHIVSVYVWNARGSCSMSWWVEFIN